MAQDKYMKHKIQYLYLLTGHNIAISLTVRCDVTIALTTHNTRAFENDVKLISLTRIYEPNYS
jgi:hypothetical protein